MALALQNIYSLNYFLRNSHLQSYSTKSLSDFSRIVQSKAGLEIVFWLQGQISVHYDVLASLRALMKHLKAKENEAQRACDLR